MPGFFSFYNSFIHHDDFCSVLHILIKHLMKHSVVLICIFFYEKCDNC